MLFLLQSVGIGLLIGVLFDLFTGWGRVRKNRIRIFILDVLFFVLAALVTFFSALAIMDGQLHPLLFGGIAIGAVLEHFTVGVWLSRCVCAFGRAYLRAAGFLLQCMSGFQRRFCGWCRSLGCKWHKMPEKGEKNRKKRSFFQKNS